MPTLIRRSLYEARPLIRLTIPIFGAQLAQAAMGTVDVMMSGHKSASDLAAVSVGTSLWVPLILLITGTLMGLTPIVAHCVGGKRHSDVSNYKGQSLWLALFMGGLGVLLLTLLPERIFGWMDVPQEVARLSTDYLRALAFGLPGLALYQALRAYSDGLNHSRPALLFSLLGLAVNIPANALLIFGSDAVGQALGMAWLGEAIGLPALGALGCGIATAISMWVMYGGMYAYCRRASAYRFVKQGLGMPRPDIKRLGELAHIGVPIGVAIFTETTLFTLIALLIAGMGEIVVSAHQIALNVTSLLFMLPLSIGMALTVRVGQALGENTPERARFVAYNGIAISLLSALLNDVILWLGRHQLPELYTGNESVQALASSLILIAIVYQVSDVLQVSMAGALRGYKDTRVIMGCTLIAYWMIGLGSGVVLSETFGLGVYGYWTGLIIGLSAAALMLGVRLKHRARAAVSR
ncbi:MATE family efflux transporter [Larsenimonas suaedae]|uniref:Multidrug-efflux transporter n=1 Tax=Larsenimonas suaedae TaxID=1851019 RepID=A0ABU1GUB7_9GAMM|nr:MATE family efflux transporter [Larsenimonas suaedae]MCM2970903.1 MATE family efflux transporter [Larsenimonas suaedae]MDR5895612.1 MATE family efflux transporter [Larsenimonas suaedae]